MKSKIALVSAFVLASTFDSRAALLVYEPFNYASGGPVALSGQAGGGGMTGTWSTTSTGVSPISVYNQGTSSGVHLNTGVDNPYVGTVSNLTTSGGYMGPAASLSGGTTTTTDHMYASRALAPSVTATFTAGSTTWFSFVSVRAFNLNASGPKFAIGASDFTTSSTNRGQTAGGEAIGIGGGLGASAGSNTNKVFGQFWDENVTGSGSFQNYDPTGLQTVNSAATVPVVVTAPVLITDPAQQGFTWDTTAGAPNIVIGKIVWSDSGPDVLSFARFLQADGALTESMFNSTAFSSSTWPSQRNVDQSQFDTISIAGARFFIDELRIATTFTDVISGTSVVPEPSVVLLSAMGLGVVFRRRRNPASHLS
jgi:hypothetical protein